MRPGVDFAQGSDRDFGVNLRGVEPSHKKGSQKRGRSESQKREPNAKYKDFASKNKRNISVNKRLPRSDSGTLTGAKNSRFLQLGQFLQFRSSLLKIHIDETRLRIYKHPIALGNYPAPSGKSAFRRSEYRECAPIAHRSNPSGPCPADF